MTAWGVNAATAVEGVHRHFARLREAAASQGQGGVGEKYHP